ncbi:ATP-binding protein [Caulobacter segnis]|uniref:ATP-binding protein n=1 Tax=Caulobacter segnis TaxID=88688 RepID=UPI0024100CA1|nr:ATP-binding protein [Caulobacter segnis]MDG2523046.1 ATP-binding protein [Caulobacter segnis]
MIRGRSILSRVLLLHACATLVTAIVVAAGVWILLETTSERLQRQTLSAYGETLKTGLRGERGRWALTDQARHALHGGGDSFTFGLLENGRLVSIGDLASPPPLRMPTDGQAAFFERVQGAKLYSGLSAPLDGRPNLRVVVVQDLDHPDVIFDDVITQVLLVAALLILVLLGLQLAIDVWIVRRTLAPVRRASEEVAAIHPHALDARIGVADLPAEVLPLGNAFNSALDRVTEAYRIERDFAADAAHELRTPLSVLQLRAEDAADPALRERLLAQIGHIRNIVERLLLIAEIDANTPSPSARVELRQVVEERVAAITSLALAKSQSITVAGVEHAVVSGEAERVARAIDALLENAVLHTPAGTSIELEVTSNAIHVSDDGPGVGDVSQADLFRRFWRGHRQSGDGSGLGLSIAARIMEQLGGTASVSQRRRGVTFSLTFPKSRES